MAAGAMLAVAVVVAVAGALCCAAPAAWTGRFLQGFAEGMRPAEPPSPPEHVGGWSVVMESEQHAQATADGVALDCARGRRIRVVVWPPGALDPVEDLRADGGHQDVMTAIGPGGSYVLTAVGGADLVGIVERASRLDIGDLHVELQPGPVADALVAKAGCNR